MLPVTGPFFSLIFAAIFLRDVERVTLRIVLSAAMIIGGVVLLTFEEMKSVEFAPVLGQVAP